ncbi:MAG: hypothetical protein R3F14_40680, partial [Polyangiaceae bacterium]
AGGVIGAAGIVLWITAPSAPSPPAPAKTGTAARAPHASPVAPPLQDLQVGAGPGGILLRGKF